MCLGQGEEKSRAGQSCKMDPLLLFSIGSEVGVFGLPEKLVCMPVDLTQPFGVFIPVSYATEDTTEFFKAYVNSSYI